MTKEDYPQLLPEFATQEKDQCFIWGNCSYWFLMANAQLKSELTLFDVTNLVVGARANHERYLNCQTCKNRNTDRPPVRT